MQATDPVTLPQPRDPFQTLFHRLFGDTLADFGVATPQPGVPRADIAETEAGYELAFELPGVEEKDIQVHVHDHTLVVTAERADQREKSGKRWHRLEHRFGRYHRTIALPNDASNSGIEAVLKNGVLTVTVPKAPEARPARIQVRGA